jgi:hypothetical protein
MSLSIHRLRLHGVAYETVRCECGTVVTEGPGFFSHLRKHIEGPRPEPMKARPLAELAAKTESESRPVGTGMIAEATSRVLCLALPERAMEPFVRQTLILMAQGQFTLQLSFVKSD